MPSTCRLVAATHRSTTMASATGGNLYLLIERALAWVESRFDTLCDDITDELEKLPRETLLSQPDLKYEAPAAKDVDSPRAHR
jgi:hypothetical protein